jgi:NTE family protein
VDPDGYAPATAAAVERPHVEERVITEPSVSQPASGPADDGLALPYDFGARYGDGLGLGVALGGGGVYFVAWQVSYLYELAARGIDLGGADRVVGTSAGSLVAAMLEHGRLGLLHHELSVLSRVPKLLGALAPAGDLAPCQQRAVDEFRAAVDADPGTIRGIGRAALAARTPAPGVMARNLALILASRRWPSPELRITCVDAYTGERCVVTNASKIGIARTVAASSAVPGLFAPQPVGDRRCMDGGVSGTGTHLDLLAGARRVVVLSLTDGSDVVDAMMTIGPGSIEREHAALEESGSTMFLRVPETVDIDTLMDPKAVPDAIEMGRRQAAADVDELRSFLA